MMVEAFPPPSFVRCRSLPLSFFPPPSLPPPASFLISFPPPLPSPAEEGGPGGRRQAGGGKGEEANGRTGRLEKKDGRGESPANQVFSHTHAHIRKKEKEREDGWLVGWLEKGLGEEEGEGVRNFSCLLISPRPDK